MAGGLSDEEFQRLQTQLLELRTSNYQLQEQCRRQDRELVNLRSTSASLEKELQKEKGKPSFMQNIGQNIGKSKKKELEGLQAENEALQHRLGSQEEEFRLQNQTLMDELTKVVAASEELEKKNAELSKRLAGEGGGSDGSPELQDEVRRLRAENTALQKKIEASQEKFDKEVTSLKETVSTLTSANADLETRCVKLSGQRGVPAGGPEDRLSSCLHVRPSPVVKGHERTVEGSSSQEEREEEDRSLESELSRLLDRELTKVLSEMQKPGETDGSSDTVLQEKLAGLREQLIPEIKSCVTRAGPVIDGVYVHSSGSSVVDLLRQTEEKCSQLEKQLEEMSDLQIRVDTEREEKTILKEQIQSLEKSYIEKLSKLQEENSKISEKLKKKQESLLQLQEEKEKMYSDNRSSIQDLKSSKEEEVKVIMDQNSRLQEELTAAQQRLQEVQDWGAQQVKERDLQLQELTAELSTRSTESKQHVHNVTTENENLRSSLAAMEQIQGSRREEIDNLQRLNSSLTGDLQAMQTAHNQLVQERDDLRCQLQEGQMANSRLLEQLQQTAEEHDQQMQALNEANRLAEKRKALLDELAIQVQTSSEQHQEQVAQLEQQHKQQLEQQEQQQAAHHQQQAEIHQREVGELREQLQEEKGKSEQLQSCREQLQEAQERLQSLENTKGWFERRLAEAEETIETAKKDHEEKETKQEELHKQEIQKLESQLESLQGSLQELQDTKDQLQETINKLQQVTKDGVDERKIVEKKGMSMVKDLKRQLHLERKRCEKLQERLQQILSERNGQAGIEDLLHPSGLDSPQRWDSSSMSSLSGVREPTLSPRSSSPERSGLAEETADLIGRITELQQQNWLLEEKVNHLESNSASMAEDLMRKSAIIQTYVTDSRTDAATASPAESKLPGGLKRMVDMVKGDELEQLRDFNRKLQRALEEEMTKNISISKDMELMSEELVRLSKVQPGVTSQQLPTGSQQLSTGSQQPPTPAQQTPVAGQQTPEEQTAVQSQ
ncbi:GRIP1-associated protein 1-like isoform X2 [Branchiostoma lanceolatum]|uniref:GRIP1-associated protein 1-like isoform X2 n=1 Tax=Branchiostoma lanceolatum TaxID=7740 RepID=UPI003453920A